MFSHAVLCTSLYCVFSHAVLCTSLYCVFSHAVLCTSLYCVFSHAVLCTSLYCVFTPMILCKLWSPFPHIDQVINMQETKKQMVNHIRIMVEQVEGNPLLPHVSTVPQGTRDYCLWRFIIICTPLSFLQKLFVLLLHFPPSMFYDRCYPALFLNGWDHHYFDSLQPEPEGIVDIRYVHAVTGIF